MAGQWSRDINLVLIFLKQFFGSFQDKQKCKKMSNMRDPKQQEVNTRLQNPDSETSSRYSGPLVGILSWIGKNKLKRINLTYLAVEAVHID